MRGPGWRGCYIGLQHDYRDRFVEAVNDTWPKARRQFDADFGPGVRRLRKIYVICYADADGYQQAVKDWDLKWSSKCNFDPRGFYSNVGPSVFVFANPRESHFGTTLAHELLHALAARLWRVYRAMPPIWAVEGYAHFAACVCCPPVHDVQGPYLAHFSRLYRERRALRLSELLVVDKDPVELDECWRVHSQAALFVRFLASLHHGRAAGWGVLRAALSGTISPPARAIELFEHAFATSIESIEAQLVDFCIDEARRLKVDSRTVKCGPPAPFYGPKRN